MDLVLVDVLAELAQRLPRWHLDAACRGSDSDLFFVGRGNPGTEARAICAGCPVVDECRRYAIDEGLEVGFFGGLSPGQRRREVVTGG